MSEILNDIIIEDILALARHAGNAIMDIYQKDFDVALKEDQSLMNPHESHT